MICQRELSTKNKGGCLFQYGRSSNEVRTAAGTKTSRESSRESFQAKPARITPANRARFGGIVIAQPHFQFGFPGKLRGELAGISRVVATGQIEIRHIG
ncbi:MAG: hypothetical protein P8M80_10670 [Pirellulaceae bacterium]|nr:hypothetical protein [Pirellulaceae bacterium]